MNGGFDNAAPRLAPRARGGASRDGCEVLGGLLTLPGTLIAVASGSRQVASEYIVLSSCGCELWAGASGKACWGLAPCANCLRDEQTCPGVPTTSMQLVSDPLVDCCARLAASPCARKRLSCGPAVERDAELPHRHLRPVSRAHTRDGRACSLACARPGLSARSGNRAGRQHRGEVLDDEGSGARDGPQVSPEHGRGLVDRGTDMGGHWSRSRGCRDRREQG